MKIRQEKKEDFFPVEQLTREAFYNVYRPGCTEHFVLHRLRKDRCFVKKLSYVIEEKGRIVAHVAYATGTLALDSGGTCPILLFGPISVLPSFQNQGYGSALIRFTLQKAKQMGYPAVVITGNPAYYRRFGFVSASKYGIFYHGTSREEESPFFMVKILNTKDARALKGVYRDPPCYFQDGKNVSSFDRLFPKRRKERRKGQLE